MNTTTVSQYSPQQLARLDKTRIPRHIAVIPDGNRRWAKNAGRNSFKGHEAGASNLIEIVKAAKDLGIKTVTVYLFSTENWIRPEEEIDALMWLWQIFLERNCKEMQEQGVRLQTIGDKEALSKASRAAVETTMEKTAGCNLIDLVLAVNYGARDEIRRAFGKILDDCTQGKLREKM